MSMHESYNQHQYSLENQEATIEFLDHFNGFRPRHELPDVQELDAKQLLCTRSGQIMLDFQNARSIMDVIRDYFIEHRTKSHAGLKQLYYSSNYPKINLWSVNEYRGTMPGDQEVRWEKIGDSEWNGVTIDRYLLHHSRYLEMPLLHIYKRGASHQKILFWLGSKGKATHEDWPGLSGFLDSGYDIISFDPRGLGETRMSYKAVSEDDPSLSKKSFDEAYVNPLSSVLADYVYNSLLTGRPYFLQMIEDVEIAELFAKVKFGAREFVIVAEGDASTLAAAAAESLASLKATGESKRTVSWSELVNKKRELWPIQDLLPGAAYIH
jgi:hypothetical protein